MGTSRTLEATWRLLVMVGVTWSILVCRPWPISTPPWDSSTEPSKYTRTKEPAWFSLAGTVTVPNTYMETGMEGKNLMGVMASPLFLV